MKMRVKHKIASSESAIKVIRDEIVPIDSILLWKDNPRKNDEAVDKLMKILSHHSQVSPVVVWIKNKTIYKGNTTWKALKKLGKKEVSVRWVDFPSESAAKAYGIDDNRSSEYAKWDEEILSKLMESPELKNNLQGFIEFAENDWRKEWQGMPEYNNAELKPFQSIRVWFKTQEDYQNFAKLINQNLTEKTITIWYPKIDSKDSYRQKERIIDETEED